MLSPTRSAVPASGADHALSLRRLWWGAIAVLGLAATAVGWTTLELRTDAIGAATAESGNIASIIAGQLGRSLEAIDGALQQIRRSIEPRDGGPPLDLESAAAQRALYETLLDDKSRLPQIFHIALADRAGRIVVSTAGWPAPDIDVSDRDYFKDARDHRDDSLIASNPLNNRVDRNRTLVFAYRLRDAHGAFAGVLFASVSTRSIEDVYGSITSVRDLLFTMLRADGTILVRYPAGDGFAGERLSAQAGRLEEWARDGGAFRVQARTDGNTRFVSVRAIPDYSLFVTISATERSALAVWRARAAAIGIGSALLLVCSIYFLVSATHQVTRLSRSEALLKHKSHELTHMALHDPLTGLGNRTMFIEKVEKAFRRLDAGGPRFGVLMHDLDRFKGVNDSLGHSAGDALLRLVAERFRGLIPDADNVARFGGDEFAVLYESDRRQKLGAADLARCIIAALSAPYDLDGRQIEIGVSIGIALAPRDGGDAEALITSADLALYQAKAGGGERYFLFAPWMEAKARERRELEDDLRHAIARGEFEIHYQTVVNLEAPACCCAEALVRWRHPTRGLVYPDQFIGVAEDCRLIVPLGEWILRSACAEAAKWPAHVKLAVNLSPVQFDDHCDLLAILKSALADSGLAPGRLKLEITETVLLEASERARSLLHQIKALGTSVVLDDFGIGYSSMRYLQMFPIDEIKIDKSFTRNIENDVVGAAIVCAIAGLGRSLDVTTTAEGVETESQLTLLRNAGCQLAQGNLFSHPLPSAQLSFDCPTVLAQRPDAITPIRRIAS